MTIKLLGNKYKNTFLKEPKECAIVDTEDCYHKQNNRGQENKTRKSSNWFISMDKAGNNLLFISEVK